MITNLTVEEYLLWDNGKCKEAILLAYKRYNYQQKESLSLSDIKDLFLMREDKIKFL